METKFISTVLLFLALLPLAYLTLASGNVKRFFNNPSKLQVYSVLRFRYHLLVVSLMTWLAGIVTFYMNPSSYLWVDDLSGFLLFVFSAVGLFMTGCLMFPAVREAKFLAPDDVKQQLSPDDPVIGLEINGESRAYPLKWIQQPQIVEDVVGETPVIVTYCAPCRKANAFSIEYEGKSLRLISPPHKEEKLMLYDAISKRIIQQESGEIVFGQGKGQTLPMVPVRIIPWVTWETGHPETKVFYYEPAESKRPSLGDLIEKLRDIDLQKGENIFSPNAKFL